MVAVSSTMVPLGTPAPAFRLPAADGTVHALDGAGGAAATLVMFLCNHCPYVRHVAPRLGALTSEWHTRGVQAFGINSNDVEAHPDDAPEHMLAAARGWGWDFPYLVDASQDVARAYRAACTPDFYVFDGDLRLAYRGQLDASRPRNDEPITGADLGAAIDAVLAGRPAPEPQHPSMGCNIKWRPGNEPEWFA